MPSVLDIALIALAAASGLCGVYWSVAVYRIVSNLRGFPTARAGLALAEADPPAEPVCVVVPAHNEQGVIGHLVRSLRAQDHPALRVVLALDRCTDGTRAECDEAIGGDERFEIIEITACPEDWAGKVHAVWTAVHASPAARSASLLLFTDADCVFHPRAVSATAALLRRRGLALLSLLSTLTHDRWFELIAQPAAGFEIARQYPLRRCNPRGDEPAARRPFANGQFMLFDGAAYRSLHPGGGHEAVRDELLEDIALARLMGERRMRTGLLLSDGIISCRMYADWAQFRRGWKRIYTEAAKRKPRRLRKAAGVKLLFASALPAAGVASLGGGVAAMAFAEADPLPGVAAGLGAWAVLAWTSACAMVYRSGHTPLRALPAFPVGAWLTAGILAEAARDLERGVSTAWGGREYARARR